MRRHYGLAGSYIDEKTFVAKWSDFSPLFQHREPDVASAGP